MAQLIQKLGLCYKDIMIVPCEVSTVEHRKDCKTSRISYEESGYLPIFASPMSSVVDDKTYKVYEENGIHSIIPRPVNIDVRNDFLFAKKQWVAYSLEEFIDLLKSKKDLNGTKILIDIANGHMEKMIRYAKLAKETFPELILMAGNIANPKTIVDYMKAGIDYCRVGIGGGRGCITTSNSGVHYPMASLVMDTYEERERFKTHNSRDQYKTNTKIIADGGVRNYDDVIKALVLGADYVMIGGLFSSCIESAGKLYFKNGFNSYVEIDKDPQENLLNTGEALVSVYEDFKGDQYLYLSLEKKNVYKKFYGMASAEGQIDMNGAKTKTAEGIVEYIPVDKFLSKWVKNMQHYLQNTMSYLGYKTLTKLKHAQIIQISGKTQESINK